MTRRLKDSIAFFRSAKLRSFGPAAFRVLGFRNYLLCWYYLMIHAPMVFKHGAQALQTRLLKSMSGHRLWLRYRGKKLLVDCRRIDELAFDGSYAFGLAKELLIWDCYLIHQPPGTVESCKSVMDLGANRGLFSLMASTFADKIIAVEADPKWMPVIEFNMQANEVKGFHVERAFLGAGGKCTDLAEQHVSIVELMERYEIEEVDFLKMDIEGSEFELFSKPEWLIRVKHLSMEVHPEFGDIGIILDALKTHGFQVRLADPEFKLIEENVELQNLPCLMLYAFRP